MRYLFAAKGSLTPEEITQAKRAVMIDGVAVQVMTVLTSNTFLIALALALGMNTVFVGILVSIPMFANVFQVVGVYILDKIQNRKGIIVSLQLIGRLSLIMIAMVPLFLTNNLGLAILVTSLVINASTGAISALSWSSWMRDLIPTKQLGSFFGRRIRYSMIAGILANLSAATFVDWVQRVHPEYELEAYSVLFGIGFIFGMIGTYFLARTHEPQMVQGANVNLLEKLKLPFKDSNFRKLLRFTSVWNFAVNIAVPFFTVYMLDRLGLSVLWVVILGVIGETAFVFFVSVWGEFADRFSNKSVLNLTGLLLIVTIFLWTFTTFPDTHQFTFPLLVFVHILGGIAISGLNLCSGNIAMKLSPQDQAPIYLAVHNLVNSIFAGIAPILGGTLFFLVESLQIQLTLSVSDPSQTSVFQTLSFESWDFYFIGAFLIGFYALYRLAFVEEEGEHVSRKALASQISGVVRRATMRASLTSIRSVASTPWIVYDAVKKKKK